MLPIVRSMALNEALLALKWVAAPVFKRTMLEFSSNFSIFLPQESVLGDPQYINVFSRKLFNCEKFSM